MAEHTSKAEHKSIVITGSTRGIGKGIARELLRRGHRVALSGRSQAAVDQALAELRTSATGDALAVGIACDVSKAADLQALWDGAHAAFGRVDIWVNNAGISHDRQFGGALRRHRRQHRGARCCGGARLSAPH